MSAAIILISRFPLENSAAKQLTTVLQDSDRCRYYFDQDNTELLQLRAFDEFTELAGATAELKRDLVRLSEFMVADVRLLRRPSRWQQPCRKPITSSCATWKYRR